jgi:hypothetical protein
MLQVPCEFVGHVNQVDFVQYVGNGSLLFEVGVFNIDVEVAHDEWGTIFQACLPSRPGGDVYPHDVILFVTHHQLKDDEVRGHDSCGLHLKCLMIRLPEQGNPPLVLAWHFC